MPFGKDSRVVTSCGCFPALSSSIQSSNLDREQKIQLQQEVLIFDFSTGEVGKRIFFLYLWSKLPLPQNWVWLVQRLECIFLYLHYY